jgi:hypothetical protein
VLLAGDGDPVAIRHTQLRLDCFRLVEPGQLAETLIIS